MDTLPAVNNDSDFSESQKEEVGYEHEGYRIRVYFNGNKTLLQCICSLAERRMEG